MNEKETINIMFQAFLQVQSMNVPYPIKNKMLGALFNMTPNGWRVVGITEKAIYRFKDYNFKYKSGMGINRSHIFPRHKRNKYLLQRQDWNIQSWWKYFYERDKCILATSTENMNKEPIISKFRVPKNMFRSSGFSFKVKEFESMFLEASYKKLIQQSSYKK
jgi:hypothetical protein